MLIVGLAVLAFLVFANYVYQDLRSAYRESLRQQEMEDESIAKDEFMDQLRQELLDEANSVRRKLGLKEKDQLSKPGSKKSKKQKEASIVVEEPEVKEYIRVTNGKVYDSKTGRNLRTIGDMLAVL